MFLLEKLYGIYSPSLGERKLKRFVKRWIRHFIEAKVVCGQRNIYITKGISESYPCLVVQLDQIEHSLGEDIIIKKIDGTIQAVSPATDKNMPLGAYGKNGLWIALKCLQQFETLKVVMLAREKQGHTGAQKADMSFFDDVAFALEMDAPGSNNFTTYTSSVTLCDDEFVRDVSPRYYGYDSTHCGSSCSVEVLKERGLDVNCANISSGFFLEDTDEEYTDVRQLRKCLMFVSSILNKYQVKATQE